MVLFLVLSSHLRKLYYCSTFVLAELMVSYNVLGLISSSMGNKKN